MKESSVRTTAQWFSLLLGGLLLLTAIFGWIYTAEFSSQIGAAEEVWGVWLANGWSNLLLSILGIAGLFTGLSVRWSRVYTVATGVIFLLLGASGIFYLLFGADTAAEQEIMYSFLPIQTENILFYLFMGAIAFVMGSYGKEERTSTGSVTSQNRQKATV